MSFYTKSKGIALIVTLVKPVAYLSKSYPLQCRLKPVRGWVKLGG